MERKRKDNHPDQLLTSTIRVVGVGSGLNRRVVYQWVVWVRLCIGDVAGVLGEGVLEQERMSVSLIISSVASRTYGDAVSDTQDFQVNKNTRECSGSDGVVLIEEVSVRLKMIGPSNRRGRVCSRSHLWAIMTAIRLGPEREFPCFVFAEPVIGEEDLEELSVNGGHQKPSSGDRTQIAYFPYSLRRLHSRGDGGIAVREPGADGLINI